MFLENLTEEDVKILDEIWAIDTPEELNAYLKTLDDRKLMKTLTLVELVNLAGIDDKVEAMDSYPDAEKMLKSIIT